MLLGWVVGMLLAYFGLILISVDVGQSLAQCKFSESSLNEEGTQNEL